MTTRLARAPDCARLANGVSNLLANPFQRLVRCNEKMGGTPGLTATRKQPIVWQTPLAGVSGDSMGRDPTREFHSGDILRAVNGGILSLNQDSFRCEIEDTCPAR